MVPPQASPTSQAISSVMPYRISFGFPVSSTSWASSKTAVSTQPPLTEPARSPPLETAIVAPTGRGAEPSTFTTVASATFWPDCRQTSMSWSNSFTASAPFHAFTMHHWTDVDHQVTPVVHKGFHLNLIAGNRPDRTVGPHRRSVVHVAEQPRQGFQALQIVYRQEGVDKGQGSADALGQRLVSGCAEQGIEPDQATAGALEPGHFVCQQLRVTPIPAVGNHHHRRAGAEHSPAPVVVERFDRFTDARAA